LTGKAQKVSNKRLQTYSDEIVRRSVVYRSAEVEIYLHEQSFSNNLVYRANALRGAYVGTCVIAARNFIGNDRNGKIRGGAKNLESNSTEPEIGAVIITSESVYGHTGIVIAITNYTITIYEGNYNWNGLAGIRELQRNNPLIVEYIIEEN
jgi:surface antigen